MDATSQSPMCDSLIQWFQTLQLAAPHRSAPELSDGVAMAQALHQLAPDTFPAAWLAKIRPEVGANWRLKVSNLKKVCAGAMDYYADCLQLPAATFRPPDVPAIAEKHDANELGVLLQLLLGCAVNCPAKQDYITAIMGLEESLQRNIMTALQELETVWQGLGGAGQQQQQQSAVKAVAGSRRAAAGLGASPVTMATGALGAGGSGAAVASGLSATTANQDRADALAQRCHEAERRVALLLEEKFTLQQEVQKMQEEWDRSQLQLGGGGPGGSAAIGDDGVSLGPVQPGSTRYTELRRQLDAMKDELLMAETQRDDFKIRAVQQEKELVGLQQRVDELSKTADELTTVKDEVDALRESAERLKVCEAQLVTFKKKLEDHHDLRRQVKQLEERNADYAQQSHLQDEHLKKGAALKTQMEVYKQEIEELHSRLDAEMMKAVKTEFELSNLGARCSALQREKESLLAERDQLRETCDELRCTQRDGGLEGPGQRPTMSAELAKERAAAAAAAARGPGVAAADAAMSEEHKAFLAQFMDESNVRIEKLRDQLKTANQKILVFEAQAVVSAQQPQQPDQDGTVLQQLKQALEQNERKATQLDDAHSQIAQNEQKISQLEAQLTVRDAELSSADARYRKSVEKTKEIIQSYDPKSEFSLTDKTVDNANNELPPATAQQLELVRPAIDSVEERLMATAYYRLSLQCHRDAMETRLALLNGAGQSFLNRQRQPAARKTPNGAAAQVFKK